MPRFLKRDLTAFISQYSLTNFAGVHTFFAVSLTSITKPEIRKHFAKASRNHCNISDIN